MSDKYCVRCEGEFEPSELNANGACAECAAIVARNAKFAEFAACHGLTRFPDPDGERYVYELDGTCAGKKGEEIDFMDEIWNALARSQGRQDLVIE